MSVLGATFRPSPLLLLTSKQFGTFGAYPDGDKVVRSGRGGIVVHDVVVIGGGAAGLSAALVLARSCRQVVLIDSGEPRNMAAETTHGFLTRDGVAPEQLLATGGAEVRRYGAQVLADRVVDIAAVDGCFSVETETGAVVVARAVVVATGLRDELPAIPGVREQWGKGVLHCPYCHGYEVRDAPLAVLGGANRAFSVHQASLVRQWSDDVLFFPQEIVLSADERLRLSTRNVHVVEGEVNRVVAHDGRLDGVELASGQLITRTAVFVGPRFTRSTLPGPTSPHCATRTPTWWCPSRTSIDSSRNAHASSPKSWAVPVRSG
ncbi:FAD-dependent oxidoreductase [Nocardia sp. NPDC056952]|uniref:FAD-dependent oxidoreductase n=1 Tax=Nocardia sp. NPDC056952 TaxID=3345979 RepID=UPI00363A33AB